MRAGAVNISAIYSPQMLPFAINALPSSAAKLPDSLVFPNLVNLSLEQLWCVRSNYDSKRVHVAISAYLRLVLSQSALPDPPNHTPHVCNHYLAL